MGHANLRNIMKYVQTSQHQMDREMVRLDDRPPGAAPEAPVRDQKPSIQRAPFQVLPVRYVRPACPCQRSPKQPEPGMAHNAFLMASITISQLIAFLRYGQFTVFLPSPIQPVRLPSGPLGQPLPSGPGPVDIMI